MKSRAISLSTAAVGPIELVRGWTSAGLSVRGKVVRFINTHLDGDCSDPAIQLVQAREILGREAGNLGAERARYPVEFTSFPTWQDSR